MNSAAIYLLLISRRVPDDPPLWWSICVLAASVFGLAVLARSFFEMRRAYRELREAERQLERLRRGLL